jgi:nitroreductase
MDYDAFMEIVRETRSVRRFKPDPVTDDQVGRIIEAGRWAPSGFNQQPWEFVVLRDPDYRAKIAGWYGEYMDQTRVMESTREEWQKSWDPEPTGSAADFSVAPVYILVLGDLRTRAGLPMSMRYNAARQEYVFTAGLSNALLYMHMAASVLGLASQWISGVASPYLHCLIKDLLGIPEQLQVYDMLAVGHPAVRPRPKLLRDASEIVHHDYCGPQAFRSDEEVRDWVRKARAWTMASHARQADEAPPD